MPADTGDEQASETALLKPFCVPTATVRFADPPGRRGANSVGEILSLNPDVVFSPTTTAVESVTATSANPSPLKSAAVISGTGRAERDIPIGAPNPPLPSPR